jgi:citrate lyase beta subunit
MPLRQRRATLFVGALALEALPAALASGADIVCIDLEDAVPPDRKDEAREKLLAHLAGVAVPPAVQLIVRVNAVGTPEGDADVHNVLSRAPSVGALLIPTVESAEEVRSVARSAEAARSTVELYAIIETALGLEGAAAIARADPRLKALFFGGFDLSTALGCEMAWEPLLYARSRVVHAAAIRGLEVLDSPFPDVDDLAALLENCSRVRALGMTGKAAKHVSQVKTILNAFTPTPAEIAKARKIVAMFREDPTRPLVYEGKLVELPTIKRMERLAALD